MREKKEDGGKKKKKKRRKHDAFNKFSITSSSFCMYVIRTKRGERRICFVCRKLNLLCSRRLKRRICCNKGLGAL